MSFTDHSPVRTALIPWVMALVALFGLNAVVPDHSRSAKSESPDGAGISQLADNAQAPGRLSSPLVLLTPATSDRFSFLSPSSILLRIETRREMPVAQSLRGEVQGRAPPATVFS